MQLVVVAAIRRYVIVAVDEQLCAGDGAWEHCWHVEDEKVAVKKRATGVFAAKIVCIGRIMIASAVIPSGVSSVDCDDCGVGDRKGRDMTRRGSVGVTDQATELAAVSGQR